MRRSLVQLSVAVLCGVLLTAANVQAQVIQWSYSPVQPEVNIFNSNNNTQSSSVTFTGASGAASGTSGIIIYNVATSSTTPVTSPDSFSNVPFNLSIRLTDIATFGQNPVTSTGTVSFAGLFNATNVTKSSLLPGTNTWTLVPGNTSPTEATVVLGAGSSWNTYTVDLTSFTPPGQPNGAPGSIQAVVTVTPGGTPPPGGSGVTDNPSATPEPASLLLAGFGVPLLFLARRRLKKAAVAV